MTIVRMGLINQLEDRSNEKFRDHWRNKHAQLARKLPALRSYVQNHVIDKAQRGISFRRGSEQLDGISQLAFDSEEAMRSAFASDVGPALIENEGRFIGRPHHSDLDHGDLGLESDSCETPDSGD